MIPDELVQTINELRAAYLDVRARLPEIASFHALLRTAPRLRAAFEAAGAPAASPHVTRPCEGRVTVAVVGSSGHGKTTVLDEMFPRLSERGWLVTDVTDTTAQSLRIEYAPPGAPGSEDVTVTSFDVEQIKELMSRPEVVEQNSTDNIRVSYHEDGVEVDGSEAAFPDSDVEQFRFPRRLRLRPFAEPYAVPRARARDRAFIRALTVKEQSAVLESAPVIEQEGTAYTALELRALVKDVALKDSFENIRAWSGRPASELKRLAFVDTPGLAVRGSVKDEVLRHFLERKSNEVALQLWKNDELDIVVHLVLAGRASDFAVLWNAIERECGPAELESLQERLVLAVNGMNIYFTNKDIKEKYEDPERARREGDHFATTLEDNILQKMSPRGRVRPARICFLDAKSIVETLTATGYKEAYRKFRPVMERWAEPGGVGFDTLEELGLVESFRENVDALADPDDRGQGFLVRQIQSVVEEQGPALLLKKHVVRTGLKAALDDLREMLQGCYDEDGRVNAETVRAALKSCLSFLDAGDLRTVERFCADEVDGAIEGIVPRRREGTNADGWVACAFRRLCGVLRQGILARSEAPPEFKSEFGRHFDQQAPAWCEAWGYESARLTAPDRGFANTADLVTHCLKLHAREICMQLLTDDRGDAGGLEQDDADREAVGAVMRTLDQARRLAAAACAEHGVKA